MVLLAGGATLCGRLHPGDGAGSGFSTSPPEFFSQASIVASPSAIATMCSAIAIDDVAPGDGALRTDTIPAFAVMRKSSTRAPSDAAGPGQQVVGGELQEVAAGGSCEAAGAQRPEHLVETGPPVPPREGAEAGPGQGLGEIPSGDGALVVALPREGEHGVGADHDLAVDARGQVHTEERIARVGHGIDQPADQVPQVGPEQVVVSAERQDP